MGIEPRDHNTALLMARYPKDVADFLSHLKPRIVWLEDERIFKREVANSFDPHQELINQYQAMNLDLGTPFRERWNDLPTLNPDYFKSRTTS